MNKISRVLILFSGLTACMSAEPVFINPNGKPKTVIGLVSDGSEISPIVVNFERYRLPGEALSEEHVYYLNNALSLETEIPSILFGENIGLPTQLNKILNISHIDTVPSQLLSFRWLKTKFLGMVFANDYPYLYVNGVGWIYIEEMSSGVYYIYSFEFKTWFYLDLFKIWSDKLIPIPPIPIEE